VKNITVSVPDDVYREARIRAAERGSSVSALVGEYLRSLSGREAEFARLEAQRKEIVGQIERFSAGDRLGRNDAAILEACRSLGCDLVLSEDLSDGENYGGVRVENPFHGC